LQSHSIGDKRQRMPYPLKLYFDLFVACVFAAVIALRLAPFGLLVNIGVRPGRGMSIAHHWQAAFQQTGRVGRIEKIPTQ
jgi:hypothetical protein